MADPDRFLSSADAAHYLGISTRYLRRLVQRGDISAYHLHGRGRPRFLREDLDRAMTRKSGTEQDTNLTHFIEGTIRSPRASEEA